MLLTLAASPFIEYLYLWRYSTYSGFCGLVGDECYCKAVASGEWAVMQGLERLKLLACSTLLSSLATANAAAIPLFWFSVIDGIVPVLINVHKQLPLCLCAACARCAANTPFPTSVMAKWPRYACPWPSMTVSMALTLWLRMSLPCGSFHQGGDKAVGIYQSAIPWSIRM